MTKDKIKAFSTEELEKKEGSMKAATGFLAGIILVLFIATIYFTIREKEFDFMMIIPIVMAPYCFINYKKINMIQSELLNRKVK